MTDYDAVLSADTPLYRVHRTRPGSVAHFDTSEFGRFNLVDIAERGTCYLAFDPLGAYIETLGRNVVQSRSEVDRRRISEVSLERDLRLFDLTHPSARTAYQAEGIDITATIGAGADYTTPQRLARLVHDDLYDGLLYSARHDPSHSQTSLALFGPAGPNDADSVFAKCTTAAVGDTLIEQARAIFGITVLPHPTL